MLGCSVIADVEDASDLWDCFGSFRPSPATRTLTWARENIVNEHGRPYDHAAYPHLGAPGGPLDSNDDPRIRTITLQFASRVGKTFAGQVITLRQAAVDPAPMMFASASEQLTKQVLKRTYKMIRKRASLRNIMLHSSERDQKQDHIEFAECEMWGAWSRSASTLADKDIKVGHANELDKWEYESTSTEGDPQKLFTDRFKNYQSVRKVLFESTPAIAGTSRIEKLRLAGSDCRFEVPCPHCRRFQMLEIGREDQEHGLRWERDEKGKSSPTHARKTARYVCRCCGSAIFDFHRPWMIRRGVWCPAGAEVVDDQALRVAEAELAPDDERVERLWAGWRHASWIRGTPFRDGPDASFQLSSLYALSLGWGDVAAEFIASKDKPRDLQNFVNQWLGQTWAAVRSKSTVEEIAERIATQLPVGTVPAWGKILVVAVDRQGADGGYVKYVVVAGGDDDRAAIVEHGIKLNLEDVWSQVTKADYPHEDGGPTLTPVVTGIDSGWDTKTTYDFCNSHRHAYALKGSNTDLGSLPYKVATLDGTTRSGASHQLLIHVNTDYWETDLQYRLDNRTAGEPGCLAANKTASRDEQFLDELTNGVLSDKIDARGNAKLLWVKKDENRPNDWRDATRYALCLLQMEKELRKGLLPARAVATPNSHSKQAPPVEDQPFVRQPSAGWIRRRT